jgi:hypothetical protein
MKIYIAYGIIICVLFAAAGTRGYVLSGLMQSGRLGGSGIYSHSQYHK